MPVVYCAEQGNITRQLQCSYIREHKLKLTCGLYILAPSAPLPPYPHTLPLVSWGIIDAFAVIDFCGSDALSRGQPASVESPGHTRHPSHITTMQLVMI